MLGVKARESKIESSLHPTTFRPDLFTTRFMGSIFFSPSRSSRAGTKPLHRNYRISCSDRVFWSTSGSLCHSHFYNTLHTTDFSYLWACRFSSVFYIQFLLCIYFTNLHGLDVARLRRECWHFCMWTSGVAYLTSRKQGSRLTCS